MCLKSAHLTVSFVLFFSFMIIGGGVSLHNFDIP